MTVRAYVRVRPRILRLLERLGLLEHRVEIEGEPFEVRWDDLLAPGRDAFEYDSPGVITVHTVPRS